MVEVEIMLNGAIVGIVRGLGNFSLTKFKRIFSNNKKKLLYELSGKIKF